MRDVGGLGYKKKTVEVRHLTGWFMIISPMEKNIDDQIEWEKSRRSK
ncbi:MAG: hypothetical protein P8L71_02140 [Flavobacteriales bacterium]|nr:hypothetical protein [Flavobacteriales bacterium]